MLPGAPASDVRVTMQAVESGYRGHRHVRWDAGSRHHRDLVDVVHKKLWDETLVREHNGKRHASRNVDQCLANRDSRIKTFLHPQSQPIEAPRRGPANERPKNYSVEDGARRSEARSVVVAGEEPNSVSCRDVLPVAAALVNDGQWRVGAELQRRRRAAVRQGTLANRFAFAADFKAEADARRISKSLRRAITDEREVFDP